MTRCLVRLFTVVALVGAALAGAVPAGATHATSGYWMLGSGFIHVHHLRELSTVGPGYQVDPVDLRPVCPNCHAMLHRQRPALKPETLKKRLTVRKAGPPRP